MGSYSRDNDIPIYSLSYPKGIAGVLFFGGVDPEGLILSILVSEFHWYDIHTILKILREKQTQNETFINTLFFTPFINLCTNLLQ